MLTRMLNNLHIQFNKLTKTKDQLEPISGQNRSKDINQTDIILYAYSECR